MATHLLVHILPLTTKLLSGSDVHLVPDGTVTVPKAKTLSAPVDEEVSGQHMADNSPTLRYQALLLVAGFLMIFQVNGINSIFGIFQEYYTSEASNIPEARGQDALVSLVGAIAYGLTYGGSIFVNLLVTRVENIKLVVLSGAVIMSLGLFLAGFCTKLWHLYATQALLFGLGATLLYFPMISIIPRFFNRHRGFAMGLVLAGNGIGGLVLSPTTHLLIERIGIRWTLRTLGFITLFTMSPIALVLRQDPGFSEKRRRGGRLGAMAVFKEPTFYAQAIGTALQAAGNIVPLFYLNTYAITVLGYSGLTASNLLAVNNVANSASRIFMGILADHVGRQNILIISGFASAITVLTLWYGATRPRFIAFVVIYGIFSGGYNALLPTTIAEVHGDENYDTVTGITYFLRGIGTMTGPPVAGAILAAHAQSLSSASKDAQGERYIHAEIGKYDSLVLYTGMLLLGASICACGVRWGYSRAKGVWKWKA